MDKPTTDPAKVGDVDIEALSRNLARLIEEGGKALAAYLKPREEGKITERSHRGSDRCGQNSWPRCRILDVRSSRAIELQTSLGRAYLDLWAGAVKRMAGEQTEPVVAPDPRDKRFTDPEWSQNQFFDFLKQAYLLTSQWADKLVRTTAGVDEHTRQEGRVLRQANRQCDFAVELRSDQSGIAARDVLSNAENLVRGMHMLSEDIKAGQVTSKSASPILPCSTLAKTSRRRQARWCSRMS